VHFDVNESIVLEFTKAISGAEEITFANQTFTLQPNALKYTVEVYNWPFTSSSNSLEIWSSISALTVCSLSFHPNQI
jgi:hypothetical protein